MKLVDLEENNEMWYILNHIVDVADSMTSDAGNDELTSQSECEIRIDVRQKLDDRSSELQFLSYQLLQLQQFNAELESQMSSAASIQKIIKKLFSRMEEQIQRKMEEVRALSSLLYSNFDIVTATYTTLLRDNGRSNNAEESVENERLEYMQPHIEQWGQSTIQSEGEGADDVAPDDEQERFGGTAFPRPLKSEGLYGIQQSSDQYQQRSIQMESDEVKHIVPDAEQEQFVELPDEVKDIASDGEEEHSIRSVRATARSLRKKNQVRSIGVRKVKDVNIGKRSACNDQSGDLSNKTKDTPKFGKVRQIDGKPHKCTRCNDSFKHKNDLATHLHMHSGEKLFHCDVCHKTFPSKGKLAKHMRIHIGEKRHVCRICKKSFSCESKLTRHSPVHTGERPHMCSLCNKSFSQKPNLSRHLRTHTGEKPHNCRICHKSFSQKISLTKHLLIHTGEKTHKCRIRDKSFGGESRSNKHVRIHTGENPFRCDVCDQSFREKGKIVRHMKIHTGKKTHSSRIRDRKFRKKSHSSNHSEVHKN